jgi:hypothetical protein
MDNDLGSATSWWVSTERMTVCVDVDARRIIVAAAPIARSARFIAGGLHPDDDTLLYWRKGNE